MKSIAFLTVTILLVSVTPTIHSHANITESIISQINEELLQYYLNTLVSFGSRYTGTDSCTKALEWVSEEFKSMKLNVTYHNWEMGGFKDKNVVATLPGNDEFIVLICAHIDTTEGSQGADDNGSGVAAVLAIAKILSQYEFEHTIKFVIVTGEEVGTYGSYNYARTVYEKTEKILAVFNFDMIGFANTSKGGKYIRFFETMRGKWLTDFAISISSSYYDLVDISVERVPNYPGSDHQGFIDYGYDAVFIAHYDRYPYGNTIDDTIEKINFSYETKATRFLGAITAEMANKPVRTYVQIREPKEGYLYVLNRPIMPIISKLWYTGLRGMTILIGGVTVIAEVIGDAEKVIFALDERMWSWVYSYPYQWDMNVLSAGGHTIRVFAYGDDIVNDEMDVITFIPYIP
jgi:hypothetical protein